MVWLNPPMDAAIQPDDALVLLAEDDTKIVPAAESAPIHESAITALAPLPPPATQTLMLGWNHRGPKIVRLLDSFAEPGSRLVIASEHPDPVGPQQPTCSTWRWTIVTLRPQRPSRAGEAAGRGLRAPDRAVGRRLRAAACRRPHPGHPAPPARYAGEAGRELLDRHRDERRCQPGGRRGDQGRRLRGQHEADQPVPDPAQREPSAGRGLRRPVRPRGSGDPPQTGRPTTYGQERRPTSPPFSRQPAGAARQRSATAATTRSGRPPQYGITLNPDKAAPLTLGADDQVIVLADT